MFYCNGLNGGIYDVDIHEIQSHHGHVSFIINNHSISSLIFNNVSLRRHFSYFVYSFERVLD